MGAEHPVVIQSMTNTLTADVYATVKQIKELEDAGSELIRITVNDMDAMKAVPKSLTYSEKTIIKLPLLATSTITDIYCLQNVQKALKH